MGTHTGLGRWSGRTFVGVGRALYLGPASDTAVHTHYAIQIAVGLNGAIRVRGDLRESWLCLDGAIIGSNRPHQFDGSGREVALIYLEPETDDGRRLVTPLRSQSFAPLPAETVDYVRRLVAASSESEFDTSRATRLFFEVHRQLGIHGTQTSALDPRIQDAIRRIRASPLQCRSVGGLARSIGLSPRRFRDLFSREIGMSCRRYLLWVRLSAAIEASAQGASLTEASFRARFSDAAHLTRTFRRMFGIVPSSISRAVTLMDAPP